MSNILKISTPVTGYENQVNKQPSQLQEDKSIKNPVIPDRVVRADSRAEYENERGVLQGNSYESNFNNFLRTLGDIPKTGEIMSKLLFSGMANIIEAGIGQGTADEVHAFLDMLKMDAEQLRQFLKNQMNGSTRLNGSLFDLLRGVMKDAGSVDLKSSILDFLRRYNDMSSGEHILKMIQAELKDIEGYMFQGDRDMLRQLSGLLLPHSLENMEKNSQILKDQILSFLGNHISETRNMGKIRDIINLVAFNISRYENGSLEQVVQAFKHLSDFPAFRKHFSDISKEEMFDLFRSIDFNKAAGRDAWADRLLSMLSLGAKGNAGIENREDFLTLIHGMLVNESVYMPVLHTMIPVILNGTPIFSEIWLDPDESSPNGNSSGENGIRMLLKFDMKDVGFFDIFCYYSGGKMDLLLHYPENLSVHDKEIRTGIMDILKRNGMEIGSFSIEQSRESIPVSAAFPKIYERRNSVNVTI